jgi:DNA-binding PadR family transcriptional regulator
MSEPVLDPTTLGVLNALLDGLDHDEDLHGWLIMRRVGRSGPRVYRSLDKLEEWGWLETWWESHPPEETGPRKRFYRLTADKVEAARSRTTADATRRSRALLPRFGLGSPRTADAR